MSDLIEKYLNVVMESDFPETILTDKSIINNFNNLQFKDINKYGNCCCGVIQHFHPSLWKASRKDKPSPFNAWKNETIMRNCIKNRIKYIGNDLSLINIRMGLTVSKLAPKVSIFRPSMAKYIIDKYLKKYQEIFDPCSGYSGRLLGAMSLGKTYIGQDINYFTVLESKNLINYFNFNHCSVECKDSLVCKGEYECLFTCSPYNDLENWNQDIENLTCDEWIDICLKNYKCKRYIFVVNHTEKYSKYIVEEILNNSYIGKSKEYIVVIDN